MLKTPKKSFKSDQKRKTSGSIAIRTLRSYLKAQKLDAFFINKAENIYWLTNFWSNDARVIATKNCIFLFANPLNFAFSNTCLAADPIRVGALFCIAKDIKYPRSLLALSTEKLCWFSFLGSNTYFMKD